jgi:hypothetical protein
MKTERVAQIVHWFGLDHSKPQEQIDIELPELSGGKIILINGPSGAGKSRLLQRMQKQGQGGRRGEGPFDKLTAGKDGKEAREGKVRWIDLADITLPDCAVVDCFPESTLEQTLLSLNRVGLAEAWDYIRTPKALSEGQKFRLKLAMGLGSVQKSETRKTKSETSSKSQIQNENSADRISVLACDEFCAILDRVTARVVARTLRRTMDKRNDICAIVATSHDDLVDALRPDVLIRCDFGKAEILELNH